MNERQKLLLRLALSYMVANLGDVCDAFQVEEEGECPNCHCGTLGFEEGRIKCRGECGHDFGEEGYMMDYNGEIVPIPIEEEIEELAKLCQ